MNSSIFASNYRLCVELIRVGTLKCCRREPQARADNLVSRPRSGDDERKRFPASIARRIVPGFNDQPLTVPGT